MAEYVRARLADSAGRPDLAVASYSVLLADNAGDPAMALRAYRGGIGAGDMALAVRAAQALDQAQQLPPDGLVLLYADALSRQDWAGLDATITRIEGQNNFSFLAPILRAWAEFGQSGNGSAILDRPTQSALTGVYAGEQRALMLLAEGRADEGYSTLIALNSGATGIAGNVIRIGAAGRLSALRRRDLANALLASNDASIRAVAALVAKGRKVPGTIDSAQKGAATLLARLASDIGRQQPTPVALALARSALLLDPQNDGIRLLTGAMMAAQGNPEGGITLLATINKKGPWAADALDGRARLLVDADRPADALAIAQGLAQSPNARAQDFIRLGEIYMAMKRPLDAVSVYDRAIALAERDEGGAPWSYWLFKGSAQHDAGQWPAARDALAKAVALAPDQAIALNYLGYSQLERRENLDEAERLIRKASELRPKDSAITDSLGWTYFVRGKVPEAIITLERAVRDEPGEPTINEHLGDAYWTAGRRIEARYAWNAALIHADEKAAVRIRAKIDFGLTPETISP